MCTEYVLVPVGPGTVTQAPSLRPYMSGKSITINSSQPAATPKCCGNKGMIVYGVVSVNGYSIRREIKNLPNKMLEM